MVTILQQQKMENKDDHTTENWAIVVSMQNWHLSIWMPRWLSNIFLFYVNVSGTDKGKKTGKGIDINNL